jgi:hypothetical protein
MVVPVTLREWCQVESDEGDAMQKFAVLASAFDGFWLDRFLLAHYHLLRWIAVSAPCRWRVPVSSEPLGLPPGSGISA